MSPEMPILHFKFLCSAESYIISIHPVFHIDPIVRCFPVLCHSGRLDMPITVYSPKEDLAALASSP
jgi:hypothetical protein